MTETTNTRGTLLLRNNQNDENSSHPPNEIFAEVLDFSEEKFNETSKYNPHPSESITSYSPNVIFESRNIRLSTTTEVPTTTSTTAAPKIKPSGFVLPKKPSESYKTTTTATPSTDNNNSLIKKYLGPLYFESIEPTTYSPTFNKILKLFHQHQSEIKSDQVQQSKENISSIASSHDTKSNSAAVISIDFQYTTPRNLVFKEILSQTFGPKIVVKPTVSPFLSLENQKHQKSHDKYSHDEKSSQQQQGPTRVTDTFSSVLADKKPSSESKKSLDIILEITKIEPKITKVINKVTKPVNSRVNTDQAIISSKSVQVAEKPFYYIRFKNTSSIVPESTTTTTEEPKTTTTQKTYKYYEFPTTTRSSYSYVETTTTKRTTTELPTTTVVSTTTPISTTTTSTTTTTTPLPTLISREILTTTTPKTVEFVNLNLTLTNTGNPPRNLTPQRASRINNSIKTSISNGLPHAGGIKCNEISANTKCNEISRPLRYFEYFP